MNILWDFDGTLFDTYPVYTKILSQVIGEKGSEEEIYTKLKVFFLTRLIIIKSLKSK